MSSIDIVRVFLSLGTSLFYKRTKGSPIYYRPTLPRIVVMSGMVLFLSFFLWPRCVNGSCYSILWDGSYSTGSLWGFYLLSFTFLPSFFLGVVGVVGYTLGYQYNEYYDWIEYSSNQEQKRRNSLLSESLVGLVASSILIGLCVWNIILMNSVGIYLLR